MLHGMLCRVSVGGFEHEGMAAGGDGEPAAWEITTKRRRDGDGGQGRGPVRAVTLGDWDARAHTHSTLQCLYYQEL